jgi:uncharacterized protein with GYD domain
MATFILQGRFSADAIKGMVANPEDRGEVIEKLTAACGGRLKDYYITTGENDFIVIVEADDGEAAVIEGMVVAAAGAVSKVTTTRAWTTAEFKKMAERAGEVAGAYKPPG